MRNAYDAVVVGAGPNGLAAAITLARAGRRVVIFEAGATVGGGLRSGALTLPGFIHDHCSAIHPLAVGGRFFSSLPLDAFGLEWITPPAAAAHPFDGSPALLLERSLVSTAAQLGRDASAYVRLMRPFVRQWDALASDILAPLGIPTQPILMARFGLPALLSARRLAQGAFRGDRARALLAGLAAHSMLRLETPVSAAPGLVLGVLGHVVGWPLPRGGSQRLADALAAYFRSLGGEIVTDSLITSLDQLPLARDVLLDVSPRQLLTLAGDRLPERYRAALGRYRYGPGVYKLDYALDGPVPWRDDRCLRAATVHLGGTLDEISASERAVWQGRPSSSPFVIVVQQSLFDDSRAPAGKHTLWAYCHVPNGSMADMTEAIEGQIERFAPGFRGHILARTVTNAAAMETYDANYIGGDINGGVQDLAQLFTRPVARRVPYSTPARGLWLCSASTPPGGGVHGLCGYHAARAVLGSHN